MTFSIPSGWSGEEVENLDSPGGRQQPARLRSIPPLASFANWPFTHLAGTPDARGLTEQERADAEGGVRG